MLLSLARAHLTENLMRRSALTRRDFVKRTAALTLASPLLGALPASRGANAPVLPPGERITLGFIGIGKQATGHLEALSGMGNTQVLAVCDVNTARREQARKIVDDKYKLLERKDYAGCDMYTNFHELLARKDIQAVVIGVPDHWHSAIAIEACKAGKDIYCEKPLTLTIHEAHTLIDAVRKHERIFQTGSQQRSEGPFRQACEYIRSGRLGKISEVHVGIGATSKWCDLPAEEQDPATDWEQWLGQAPMRPYNEIICRKGLPSTYPFNPGWRDYREYSGGYITDWGAHHFDITQWALDMDHSGPVEVRPAAEKDAKFGAQVVYRGSPVGDEIVVTHVNKVYEYDTLEPEKKKKSATQPAEPEKLTTPRHVVEENGILFIGDKGKLFVNRSTIRTEPETILATPLSAGDVSLPKNDGHRQNWLECIKSRQLPICDVETGARSVTVCHLINLAYWHGRKLTWDPAKWEFPGDKEANGWRTRDRRKGYELPEI
jgi:predicted dehydrogenase